MSAIANNFSAFEALSAPVKADSGSASFVVGKSYSTRSAGNHECVFSWTITARKGQMLTLKDADGAVSRRKVLSNEEGELCFPMGKFSMCPVIRACRADE